MRWRRMLHAWTPDQELNASKPAYMKRNIILYVIAATSLLSYLSADAQSRSFQTFRDRFKGDHDVHCFGVNGSIVRMVLGIAGEQEAKEAVRNIHKVRMAIVPREAFLQQQVTVAGFRKVMREDAFDELMSFRENGDEVTVYSNTPAHSDDQYYLMLVRPTMRLC